MGAPCSLAGVPGSAPAVRGGAAAGLAAGHALKQRPRSHRRFDRGDRRAVQGRDRGIRGRLIQAGTRALASLLRVHARRSRAPCARRAESLPRHRPGTRAGHPLCLDQSARRTRRAGNHAGAPRPYTGSPTCSTNSCRESASAHRPPPPELNIQSQYACVWARRPPPEGSGCSDVFCLEALRVNQREIGSAIRWPYFSPNNSLEGRSMSKHEDSIVAGANRLLLPDEKIVSALVVSPRGSSTAGAPGWRLARSVVAGATGTRGRPRRSASSSSAAHVSRSPPASAHTGSCDLGYGQDQGSKRRAQRSPTRAA